MCECDFWRKLFLDVLKRYGCQKQAFLRGTLQNLKRVNGCLNKFVKKLQSEYSIICHRETLGHETMLSLSFTKSVLCSKEIRHFIRDEIYISITCDGINLYLCSHSHEVFPLLNYQLVENIIEDFCREFFNYLDERYLEFLNFCKRIQNGDDRLTYKNSIIARSSIESLYNASEENTKIIKQGQVYSTLNIDGEDVFVLHQDFLDDPQALIKKLQKK